MNDHLDIEEHNILFTLIAGIFLAIYFVITYGILSFTDGRFIFTLDDAYIHFALAENILNGHYGINLEEYSAPASSILWPYLMAPIMLLKNEFTIAYAVFAINILLTIATMYVYWLTLIASLRNSGTINNLAGLFVCAALLIFLTINTNLIGLPFLGMEHSLQVFVCASIAYGCIKTITAEKMPWWLFIAIVLAPLIRYDAIAVSLPAALFLFLTGYIITSTIAVATSIAGLFAFGLFLQSKGLGFFPSSILSKSSVATSGEQGALIETLWAFWHTLKTNLDAKQSLILILLAVCMALSSFNHKNKYKLRILSGAFFIAICLHFVAGRFDWFDRYEIYILAPAFLIAVFIFKTLLFRQLQQMSSALYVLLILVATPVLANKYIKNNLVIPESAFNIFEQQYHVHRFLTEYYKKPVAINDLGYPSFQNNAYVLDLWGLGSYESLNKRKTEPDSLWIGEMAEKKGIELAIIYDYWFPQKPENWHKVAETYLSGPRHTAGGSTVSYYAVDCRFHQELAEKLYQFFSDEKSKIYYVVYNECRT